jgi:hypothetical protein
VESGSKRRSLACQRVGAGSPVMLLCGRRELTGERRLGPLISTPPSESQRFVWCMAGVMMDGEDASRLIKCNKYICIICGRWAKVECRYDLGSVPLSRHLTLLL